MEVRFPEEVPLLPQSQILLLIQSFLQVSLLPQVHRKRPHSLRNLLIPHLLRVLSFRVSLPTAFLHKVFLLLLPSPQPSLLQELLLLPQAAHQSVHFLYLSAQFLSVETDSY